MSGFSPEWLSLREPIDHRSRNSDLAARLATHFSGRATIRVVDLGCGTGSNIRATAPLLGKEQHWTLVDYDTQLLEAANVALRTWADSAMHSPVSGVLVLEKGERRLHVDFQQVDLQRNLDQAIGSAVELVTASAFFDLCSEAFIGNVAAAVVARRAAFYTVLTYNGVQTWQPAHSADDIMCAAFHRHQKTDKGFGAAAGPGASAAIARAFAERGYIIEEGDSPWHLKASDTALVEVLASGFADAVAETGDVIADVVAKWRKIARTAAVVGHTDTLALPGHV